MTLETEFEFAFLFWPSAFDFVIKSAFIALAPGCVVPAGVSPNADNGPGTDFNAIRRGRPRDERDKSSCYTRWSRPPYALHMMTILVTLRVRMRASQTGMKLKRTVKMRLKITTTKTTAKMTMLKMM